MNSIAEGILQAKLNQHSSYAQKQKLKAASSTAERAAFMAELIERRARFTNRVLYGAMACFLIFMIVLCPQIKTAGVLWPMLMLLGPGLSFVHTMYVITVETGKLRHLILNWLCFQPADESGPEIEHLRMLIL